MDAKYKKIHLPNDELYQTHVCHNICKENIHWVLIPPNARVMRLKSFMCVDDMLHILKELEHMVLMMPNLKAHYLIYRLQSYLVIRFAPPMLSTIIKL
jgi:hypothetical protein